MGDHEGVGRQRQVLRSALPDLDEAFARACHASWEPVSARMMLALIRLRISAANSTKEFESPLSFLRHPPSELVLSTQFADTRERMLSMVAKRLAELTDTDSKLTIPNALNQDPS